MISPHALARTPHSTSPPDVTPFERADIPQDTVELARALLGCVVLTGAGDACCVARIVETEAYPPGDPASHAFRGRTPRNGAMFGPPGHAYVYFIYGMWFCFNVSSERAGVGAAVLLRAAEPLVGHALMRARGATSVADRELCRGPGRLARALGLSRLDDGVDLFATGPLRLARTNDAPPVVGTSTRIGLRVAADRPLRFYVRGSASLSGPQRLSP